MYTIWTGKGLLITDGMGNDYGDTGGYCRPIVCMKTSVFQEKYEKTLADE